MKTKVTKTSSIVPQLSQKGGNTADEPSSKRGANKEGNKMSLKQLAQAGDLDIDFGLGEEDVLLMAGATTDQPKSQKKEISILKPIVQSNGPSFRRSSRLSKKYSELMGANFEYGGDKLFAPMDSCLEGMFKRSNSKGPLKMNPWANGME